MFDNLLIALLIIFVLQVLFFSFAAIFKTDKVTDLAYGLTFIFVAIFYYLAKSGQTLPELLVTVLISSWGFRLTTFLFIRILKTEKDSRFDKIRGSLVKFGGFWVLQTLTIWVVLLPALALYTNSIEVQKTWVSHLGLVIWFLGFSFEAMADQQKYNFRIDLTNKDKWISSGLWKYSRHPNYFGEILIWWGIYIIVLPYLSGIYYLSVIGPIFISLMLLFVSGIPILEKKADKKFGSQSGYQEYKAKTSILIPFPPKSR